MVNAFFCKGNRLVGSRYNKLKRRENVKHGVKKSNLIQGI
jgi:hypothetical protein